MDRFIVKSITGFTNDPKSSGSYRTKSTTYWVADTAYCFREMLLLSPNDGTKRNGTVIGKGKPNGNRMTFFRSVAEYTAKVLNERYGK